MREEGKLNCIGGIAAVKSARHKNLLPVKFILPTNRSSISPHLTVDVVSESAQLATQLVTQ